MPERREDVFDENGDKVGEQVVVDPGPPRGDDLRDKARRIARGENEQFTPQERDQLLARLIS